MTINKSKDVFKEKQTKVSESHFRVARPTATLMKGSNRVFPLTSDLWQPKKVNRVLLTQHQVHQKEKEEDSEPDSRKRIDTIRNNLNQLKEP